MKKIYDRLVIFVFFTATLARAWGGESYFFNMTNGLEFQDSKGKVIQIPLPDGVINSSDRFEQENSSLEFAVPKTRIEIPILPDINSQGTSICFWANFNEFTGSISDGTEWQQPIVWNAYAVLFDSQKGSFLRQFRIARGPNYQLTYLVIEPNKWNHYAITVEENRIIRFYLNGELVETDSSRNPLTAQVVPNWFGEVKYHPFDGKLDDVLLTHTYLPPQAIEAIYNNSKSSHSITRTADSLQFDFYGFSENASKILTTSDFSEWSVYQDLPNIFGHYTVTVPLAESKQKSFFKLNM